MFGENVNTKIRLVMDIENSIYTERHGIFFLLFLFLFLLFSFFLVVKVIYNLFMGILLASFFCITIKTMRYLLWFFTHRIIALLLICLSIKFTYLRCTEHLRLVFSQVIQWVLGSLSEEVWSSFYTEFHHLCTNIYTNCVYDLCEILN